jgi:hypothetical protein
MQTNAPGPSTSITGSPSSPRADDSDVSRFHNYAPWANVILGLMVFALRYAAPRGTFAVHWNLFLTGIVLMFAALAATIAHEGASSKNYWSVINLVAGGWLLISVIVVPSVARVTIAEIVLGALVIAVSLVSLAIEHFTPKIVA